ncbi:homocysteine S-methyltransferase family protein, partial [Streptomyces sp. NPDC056982]|uniref:homocysteine S-methyltransferase family protein n=1 Tax=Streptomyces sp. NPDC056982 TaxID=3345986 RepID=UPI00363322A6
AGDAYVLGTMGGIRTFNKNAYSLDEIKRSFREQLYLLLHEEPDGLLLETYYDLEEAREVLKIARKETDLPIMLNVSMHEQGVLQDGTPLSEALRSIADLGADIVGINCRLGPYHMIEALSEVPIFDDVFLSVYPNSSLPSLEEGRLVYETDGTYFQNSASEFRKQGARIIGGCCGTTPNHIGPTTGCTWRRAPPTTSWTASRTRRWRTRRCGKRSSAAELAPSPSSWTAASPAGLRDCWGPPHWPQPLNRLSCVAASCWLPPRARNTGWPALVRNTPRSPAP